MTVSTLSERRPVRSAQPSELGRDTILGISASLKPAPGSAGRSAALSLLSYALGVVADAHLDVALLDLRAVPPPLFDGRLPADRDDENLRFAYSCIEQSGGLFVAIPAYWSGVSGVFKNLVDVLCGPAYDLPRPATTVFTGKPVAVLVVGADDESASEGAREAPRILASTGARLVGPPVSVANPRAGLGDSDELSRRLIILCGELGRAVHHGKRATC